MFDHGFLARILLAAAAVNVGVALVACAAEPTPPSQASGEYVLRPDFSAEPATTYEHAVRVVQVQQTGESLTLEANLGRRFTVRTLETSDAGALVEVAMERITLRVLPPAAPVWDFDSARRAEDDPKTKPELARSLRALVGVKAAFRVSRDGAVVTERGAEDIARALAIDPKSSMAAYFDEPVLRELVHDIFVLPGPEPRAVGESWARTTTTEVGGNKDVLLEVRMTLRSVEDGAVEIVGTGEFKLGELKPLVRGLETKIEQQVSQFTARWSLGLGRLTSMENEQSLVLDQGGGLMDIKARLSTRSRLHRVDPSGAEPGGGLISLPPAVITEPAPEKPRGGG